MTAPDEADAALEAEITGHLERARIPLPPGRMPEVVQEYRVLKQQIETVRAACAGDAEPAVIFHRSRRETPP